MKHIITIVLLATVSAADGQLTGTLTVGGNNPDYETITAAVNALMSEGAAGNVLFNIRPGTYTGQYDLGTVPGNYGFITFKSQNNIAASVVLEFDASSSSDNFIFRLNGTDGIVLDHLTFRPTDTWFARCIHFFNACELFSVNECVFEGSAEPNQNSGFERNIVQCDQNDLNTTDNPQDVIISDCTFLNGYAALDLNFEGNGGARSGGLIIVDNRMEDQYATGITVMNAVGQIGDNLLTTDVGIFYTGIRTQFFDNGSQIRRNQVRAYVNTGGCTGIEVGNTQNTTGNMISNNMVYCDAPGDVWGIAVYNLWDMKIVHNSVLIGAGNEFQSYAFYHLSGFPDGQDALVRNNIFANHAGGHAYNVDVAGNVAVEDHNCLFTTGPNLSEVGSGFYADLAAHQAGSGMGMGDTDMDPVFPIQPDLHLNGCTNGLAGEYYFVLASDIDGDARGNPVCDMGADEFTFSSTIDAGIININVDDLPYTLSAPVGTSYQWSQGATTQSIDVVTEGPYSCEFTDVNGCTYTITWFVNVDFSTSMETVQESRPTLFPVPAIDVLQVTGLVAGAAYEVVDVQGRVVRMGSTLPLLSIDVRELSSGMHLLRWSVGAGLRNARFIKQ